MKHLEQLGKTKKHMKLRAKYFPHKSSQTEKSSQNWKSRCTDVITQLSVNCHFSPTFFMFQSSCDK